MSRARVQIQFAILALLLVGLFVAQSAKVDVQARVEITPTITPDISNWNYMPLVRASGQLPPLATPTATPTATATVGPTNTPAPGRLAAPTLFDIINDDNNGSFTVGWSTVPDAEFYRIEQRRNGGTWQQVYEGPALSLNRGGLADGQYCYRVRALNSTTDSEWSAVKCANVTSATNTPTPTLTPTPGSVPAPVIKDIENVDGDGNFVVEWSTVAGIDGYRLREGVNGAEDAIIYAGAEPRFVRSNLPKGTYCYRVRAIIEGGEWGPYSEMKCTTVTKEAPRYECTFETLYDGPRTNFSAMTMLHSGEVFIAGGADVNYVDQTEAYVFDPDTREFRFVGDTRYAGHREATTLADGRVLLPMTTPWGEQNPMEIFDPITGEFAETQSLAMCYHKSGENIATAITMSSRDVLALCPDWDGEITAYVYDVVSDEVELWFVSDYPLCFRRDCQTTDPTAILVDEWIISNTAVAYKYEFYPKEPGIPTEVEIINNDNLRPWISTAIALSWDGRRLYGTGGEWSWIDMEGNPTAFSRQAIVLDTETYTLTKLPSLNRARTGHSLVPLPNGNMVVLAGSSPREPIYAEDSDFTEVTNQDEVVLLNSVELFDAESERFYDAGSLNVKRKWAQAITLLNGEILVYGGRTEPGPGYSTIAPPEIGSCKKIK